VLRPALHSFAIHFFAGQHTGHATTGVRAALPLPHTFRWFWVLGFFVTSISGVAGIRYKSASFY